MRGSGGNEASVVGEIGSSDATVIAVRAVYKKRLDGESVWQLN